MQSRRAVLTTAIIGGLAVIAAGAVAASAAHRAKAQQDLRIGAASTIATLDIQDATEFEALQQLYPMFDSLLQVSQQGKLAPGLATSWTVASNGKRVTLNLRHDVRFHDGTAFDAKAVKFNIARETNSKNPFHKCTCVLPGAWLGNLAQVKVLGKYKVELDLKTPSGQATLWNLTAVPGEMESPAALRKYGANFKTHPVGTGPFQFVSWNPSGGLVMKRNPTYWGKRASINRLIIVPYTDPQARVAALLSHAVDGILEPPPSALPTLQKNSKLTSVHEALDQVAYVALDVKRPPFDKPEVRQAFSYAINRAELSSAVLKGIGEPVSGVFPKNLFGFKSESSAVAYNPAKAKQLLAQAGYPKGVDFNWLVPISGVASPEPETWATYLQANLQAVGLRAHIQTLEASTTLGTEAKGLANTTFNAGTIGWVVLTADPDSFVSGAFATAAQPPNGFNISVYSNPTVDGAINRGRSGTTAAARASAYGTVQDELAKDMPWVPVFTWVDWAVTSRSVAGISIRPNAVIHFEGARVG
jgi:peptide/nickel transport system substrate-binding protein